MNIKLYTSYIVIFTIMTCLFQANAQDEIKSNEGWDPKVLPSRDEAMINLDELIEKKEFEQVQDYLKNPFLTVKLKAAQAMLRHPEPKYIKAIVDAIEMNSMTAYTGGSDMLAMQKNFDNVLYSILWRLENDIKNMDVPKDFNQSEKKKLLERSKAISQ